MNSFHLNELVVGWHSMAICFLQTERRECWKSHVQDCAVTAITKEKILVEMQGNHPHPLDQHKINLKKKLHAAKENAKAESFKKLKRVFECAFGRAHVEDEEEEAVDALCRQTRYRSRATRLLKLPHTRQDIALQGEWAQTTDERPFFW